MCLHPVRYRERWSALNRGESFPGNAPARTRLFPLQASGKEGCRLSRGLATLFGRGRRLTGGLAEPGFETRLAEPRAIPGNERFLLNVHAVVAPLRVDDNLARILDCGQALPGKFIEVK